MSEEQDVPGDGMSDDHVDRVVEEAAARAEEEAGDAEAPHDRDADAAGQPGDSMLPPADPGARDLARIIDQVARTVTGAPQPEGAEIELTTAEGRADLAGRLLTPAYRQLGGAALPWWLALIAGLALLLGSAYAEGQLANGGSGDDRQTEGEGASPVSEDAATPDDYLDTGGSAEPPPPPEGGESQVEEGDEVVSYAS